MPERHAFNLFGKEDFLKPQVNEGVISLFILFVECGCGVDCLAG
jgi:hypothetical protein